MVRIREGRSASYVVTVRPIDGAFHVVVRELDFGREHIHRHPFDSRREANALVDEVRAALQSGSEFSFATWTSRGQLAALRNTRWAG